MNKIIRLIAVLSFFSFGFTQAMGNPKPLTLKQMQEKLKKDPLFIKYMCELYEANELSLADFTKGVHIALWDLDAAYGDCLLKKNCRVRIKKTDQFGNEVDTKWTKDVDSVECRQEKKICRQFSKKANSSRAIINAFLEGKGYSDYFDDLEFLAAHGMALSVVNHTTVSKKMYKLIRKWKQEQEQ